uniref:Peptidase S1 domain-containing protein n=1 Tax=Trichuris muris TaxID=70415 RepID=A0A5S6QIV4_TRIMR
MLSRVNAVLFILVWTSFQFSSICEAICGQPHFMPLLSLENVGYSRIANGIEARKHSHPWQAFITVNFGKKMQSCGGSLIDWYNNNATDLVLTAAHCLIEKIHVAKYSAVEEIKFYWRRHREKGKYVGAPIANASQLNVFLGVHHFYAFDENTQRLAVVGLAADYFNKYTWGKDIALLKLERKVVYNKFIQGICLPSPNEDLPIGGYPCFVTGWGYLDGKKTEAGELQQIEVDIFKRSMCMLYTDTKTMFCAGSKKTHIGTCPLVQVAAISTGHYEHYSRQNDIALLKLKREVPYDERITGVCIPSSYQDTPLREQLCYVTGWGRMNNGNAKATVLQQIEVRLFEGETCGPYVNLYTMFCAGSKTENIGICLGDSGGPLVCDDDIYHPAVFTKVSAYLPWLKQTALALQ